MKKYLKKLVNYAVIVNFILHSFSPTLSTPHSSDNPTEESVRQNDVIENNLNNNDAIAANKSLQIENQIPAKDTLNIEIIEKKEIKNENEAPKKEVVLENKIEQEENDMDAFNNNQKIKNLHSRCIKIASALLENNGLFIALDQSNEQALLHARNEPPTLAGCYEILSTCRTALNGKKPIEKPDDLEYLIEYSEKIVLNLKQIKNSYEEEINKKREEKIKEKEEPQAEEPIVNRARVAPQQSPERADLLAYVKSQALDSIFNCLVIFQKLIHGKIPKFTSGKEADIADAIKKNCSLLTKRVNNSIIAIKSIIDDVQAGKIINLALITTIHAVAYMNQLFENDFNNEGIMPPALADNDVTLSLSAANKACLLLNEQMIILANYFDTYGLPLRTRIYRPLFSTWEELSKKHTSLGLVDKFLSLKTIFYGGIIFPSTFVFLRDGIELPRSPTGVIDINRLQQEGGYKKFNKNTPFSHYIGRGIMSGLQIFSNAVGKMTTTLEGPSAHMSVFALEKHFGESETVQNAVGAGVFTLGTMYAADLIDEKWAHFSKKIDTLKQTAHRYLMGMELNQAWDLDTPMPMDFNEHELDSPDLGNLEDLADDLPIDPLLGLLHKVINPLSGGAISARTFLIEGGSGAGKTMLVRMLHNELKKHLGDDQKVTFLSLPPKMFNVDPKSQQYDVFQQVEFYVKNTSKETVVIWIDEAHLAFLTQEGTLDPNRTYGFLSLLSEVNKQRSPNSGVILILGTNRPNMLPPELRKNGGRINHIITLTPPTYLDCKKITEKHLQKLGYDISKFDIDSIVHSFTMSEASPGVIINTLNNAISIAQMRKEILTIHHIYESLNIRVRNMIYKIRDITPTALNSLASYYASQSIFCLAIDKQAHIDSATIYPVYEQGLQRAASELHLLPDLPKVDHGAIYIWYDDLHPHFIDESFVIQECMRLLAGKEYCRKNKLKLPIIYEVDRQKAKKLAYEFISNGEEVGSMMSEEKHHEYLRKTDLFIDNCIDSIQELLSNKKIEESIEKCKNALLEKKFLLKPDINNFVDNEVSTSFSMVLEKIPLICS